MINAVATQGVSFTVHGIGVSVPTRDNLSTFGILMVDNRAEVEESTGHTRSVLCFAIFLPPLARDKTVRTDQVKVLPRSRDDDLKSDRICVTIFIRDDRRDSLKISPEIELSSTRVSRVKRFGRVTQHVGAPLSRDRFFFF